MLLTEQCGCVLAGVEVWVLAQSAARFTAGIPDAAEMVCNGYALQDPKGWGMTVRLAAVCCTASCYRRVRTACRTLITS
jgi:hypothetical protein